MGPVLFAGILVGCQTALGWDLVLTHGKQGSARAVLGRVTSRGHPGLLVPFLALSPPWTSVTVVLEVKL